MTATEFKAWFEGFCEAIKDKPNEEQFKKIKEKVQSLHTTQGVKYRPIEEGLPKWQPTMQSTRNQKSA